MTIRPYASIADQSKPLHSPENLLSTLSNNNDENPSKKIKIEVSKTELVAKDVLESSCNKNIDYNKGVLNNHSVIKTINGKSNAEKEFFIHAIACNSKDESSYYKLARMLQNDERVTLLNGEIYTNQELLLKAIELNPKDARIYGCLAKMLQDDERVTLLNGEIYTNQELLLKAIELNPKDARIYGCLAKMLQDDERVTLLNGEIYTNQELLLKAIELNPKDTSAYGCLARMLQDDERVTLLNGEIYTKKELYIKAIELNPAEDFYYFNLIGILQDDETVIFFDGTSYTKKELYLKVIELNPTDDLYYFNLADMLQDDERVTLLNGEAYTKKELYLKAIELNPIDDFYYFNLANMLQDNERVTLLNGEAYTKKEFYIKAIELNPTNENAYNRLAYLLEEDETAQLLNREVYTKKELYIKVIDLNPTNRSAYNNLADLLEKNKKVQFLNGEVYTKKELYLKAIELDPEDELAYNDLANLLKDHETVKLLNGETYTKKELYIKAIELNSEDEMAYNELANLLKDHETAKLLNGETYTKKELYIKAIDLNPEDELTYNDLADLLKDNETVKLLNGEVYNKKELYLKAIDLGADGAISSQSADYLKRIYTQEIENNPNNIEGYFNLISIIQNDTVLLKDGELADSEVLFKRAFDIDPIYAFSSQSAPTLFSVASSLYHKTKSLLRELSSEFTLEDSLIREELLKRGTSLTFKNDKVISAKALYQQALPSLSLEYLKCQGVEEIGDYLPLRKYTVLQDESEFTKVMAYVYAYEKHQSSHILMKIGDALHPEERILLNGNYYDKRACYEKAALDNEYVMYEEPLRIAESLYPHDHLRKKDLFSQVLDTVHTFFKDRLEIYTALARILSRYELTDLQVKYLFIFGEFLKEHLRIKDKDLTESTDSHYKDLDYLNINDNLYLTKKQEVLLDLLKIMPACEEAYVALATNFQHSLTIQANSYTSKEALYLKAIDINSEYSLPYFLLGKELFNQKIESIQLLNGVTLSCKQLLMRAIQLGTYEAEAYHLAALIIDDREGILLFDGKTILSKGDLFIRAFELEFSRIVDLKNFILYTKRGKNLHLKHR